MNYEVTNIHIQRVITTIIFTTLSSLGFAAGDLSRDDPTTIVLEMGSDSQGMFFKPNHLEFETGKAYKLVLKNPDKIKHELEANEFIDKIFTRKVEIQNAEGGLVAEIKGHIREVEVGPESEVEWFFVPVQTGENIEMKCAISGHFEAGMHGLITIK